MDKEPHVDLVEFGGGDRSARRPAPRRVAAAIAVVLAIAVGFYWSHRASHPSDRAGTSLPAPTVGPPDPTAVPSLYVGGETGFGFQGDSGRRTFWIVFALAATPTTISSATPSVDALVGLADAQVMLLSTATARRFQSSGSFDGAQSLDTLPRGENLTVVVIGRPYCVDMPDRQAVIVHVAYTGPDGGVGSFVIRGAPDLTATDFHSTFGPCPTASQPSAP